MLIHTDINFIFEKDFLSGTDIKSSFKKKVKSLVKDILKTEEKDCSSISFIFCGDDFIRGYNKQYLSHDYPTDIITFPNEDDKGITESDIMISTETVLENSEKYKVSFEREMERVIIHGVLHLCGYNDKTASQKLKMRKREDYFLEKLDNAGQNN